MLNKRLKRTLIFCIIGLALGMSYGFYNVIFPSAAGISVNKPSAKVAGIRIGGEMALVDHNGVDVTQSDYADFYKLIFFGFTYCPAVCSTELQRMEQVMAQLGDFESKIQPIFITVDPERDDVEVMHDYVASFHPRLVGLTGSRDQIDKVLADFRIYASRVDMPGMEGDAEHYMMDHSAYMYLIAPGDDGDLISIYHADDSVEKIATDLVKRLK